MTRHLKLTCLMGLLLLFLQTSPGHSEPIESPYRWTIGYERYGDYSDYGPVLRRFLGQHWEVFFSGGPDDRRFSESRQGWDEDISSDHPAEYESVMGNDSNKTESGWVMLGGGRRLLKEGGFWLTAVVGVEYSWTNYQDYDFSESELDPLSSSIWTTRTYENDLVGHRQEVSIYVGFRPAYDVTSRIILSLNFGLVFETAVGTHDLDRLEIRYYPDGSVYEIFRSHDRITFDKTSLDTFGYYGTSNLSFSFRF